jgi:hypothetical protein
VRDVGATRNGYLSGKERPLELLLCEWRPETYTGRSACKAQVVRRAAIRKGIDAQRHVQLIQQGTELTDAELADEPVFELIESDSGQSGEMGKSRLRQAPRKAGPANSLAYLFKVQSASRNIKYDLLWSGNR